MEQGGVRMIGLRGHGRPHTAPRLGDTAPDPEGVAGVKLLPGRRSPPPDKVSIQEMNARASRSPKFIAWYVMLEGTVIEANVCMWQRATQ